MTLAKNKKIFIITFLIVFLFTASIGGLTSKNVKAQLLPMPVIDWTPAKVIVADIPAETHWWADVVSWIKEKSFTKIIANAFSRTFQRYMETLAYNSASFLAGGIEGGKSAWSTDNWNSYMVDARDAATAEFLDSLASGYDFDICKPPGGINIQNKVNLIISTNEDKREPRCSLNDIKKKWGDLGEKLQNDPLTLMKINNQSLKELGFDKFTSGSMPTLDDFNEVRAKLLQSSINIKESDLGYIQEVENELARQQQLKEEMAEKERINPDGSKPKRNPITGDVIVPAEVAKGDLGTVWNTSKESAATLSDDPVVNIANIFLNTLVSKSLRGLINRLFIPKPPQYDEVTEDRGLISNFNREVNIVEKTFAQIKKISYNINLTDIDVIAEMEMDLGNDLPGIMNNKTISSDFAEALRKAQAGEVLTLKEAIEENLVDQNKWFGYIDVASQNPKQPSVVEGFSADNIKKLVKNRVVSVGWLFAAEKIKELKGQIIRGCSSQGCTLENVLEEYDKSGTYNVLENEGEDPQIYKNEYCGWRSINAEPYFIDINNANDCELNEAGQFNGISGIELKWSGASDSISGKCYRYEDLNGDSIIDEISLEAENRETCETLEPSFEPEVNGLGGYYYEWEPGGCLIKELDESPLCHLVDPNTVLKAPAQQCGAEGYYSILETRNTGSRQEDCADVKHCIEEDDDGRCVGGYDYCVKEENIWRFNGDSCSKQFNSCTTLIDDQGQRESYLIDTLRDCPQEEVGCRDYIFEKELIDDQYVWDNDAPKAYFNSSVEECNDNALGCNEFIQIKPGVNLIANGSFEINEGPEDEKPDFWNLNNGRFSLERDAYLGNYSLKHIGGNEDLLSKENLLIPDKGLYTLSYYVRAEDSDVQVKPKLLVANQNGVTIPLSNEDAIFNPGEVINNWQRVSGHFSIPENQNVISVDLIFQIKGDVYLDGVQLELNELVDSDLNEGEGDTTTYQEYGQVSQAYFKKAPDYLNCEDYSLDSYNCDQEYHPCCDYVKYCPVEDLSCSAFYPINGDPFVPAVINNEDQCVAECNNYQTFSALPSYFDNLEALEESGEEAIPNDSNFIAESAEDCSEPSCELFTNIDKLELGAEAKEYYSAVRQCVKPDDSGVSKELYYTWEGSDTSAFQLKTWELLASDDEDHLNGEGGKAPCTNVLIGNTSCLDDVNNVEECNPETNLDCRTFYDEDALPHNRLLSKTIPITEECINVRREISNQVYKIIPSMSNACDVSNLGCTTYQGNDSNNVRNIFREDFESGSTAGWMADIDGGGSSINLVHSSEAIHYNGSSMKVWVGDDSEAIWISYNLTEAGEVVFPGKQYSLSFWAKSFGDNTSGFYPAQNYDGLENTGGVLSLNSLLYNKAQASDDDASLIFDNNLSVINREWLLYNYNVTDFKTDQNGDVVLSFKINIDNSIYEYDGIYIDNIILKALTSSFDKIKDSWQTPRVCLDNDYLGCQAYQDPSNNISYLYQFTDLCPEENIGCQAMIDTQNSSMPGQQTFNAYCSEGSSEEECNLGNYYYQNDSNVPDDNIFDSTVIVPSDDLVYIVADNDHSCLSGNKGCQEMSIIDNEGVNQAINIVSNPDHYVAHDMYGENNNILCLDEYQNCVSFSNLEGSKLHKIHPRNLTCEYQEEDTERNIPAGFYNQDGENCAGLIYSKAYDDFTFNIVEQWKPYDDYQNQYAGVCPTEENSCSGFIDPLDNLDFSDYVYSHLGINLNYNHPSEWRQASWSKDNAVIDNFGPEGISYHPASNEDDYEGLNIILSGDQNLLIYRGPDYTDNIFNFNVAADTTYRLSARVKLEDADSVMTFLSCKPNSSSSQDSFEGYFVNEDWYEGENNIPYAFPAIKSNYSTTNNDQWQYIYGLYEILPGAQYCNMAFYINGESGSKFTIADMNLEKVSGDYYYLDNDYLDYDSCNSANLKEGCVLFHDISETELKWNHQVSYEENRLAPGDSRNPSDVNALLKVTRDKQCAEWLTCGASLKTIDQASGQTKEACVSLIACDELSEDKAGVCTHPFFNGATAQPLTLDYYHQMRGKSEWSDLDYSGYSIPGLYPLDSLTPLEVVNDTGTSTVLGHLVLKQNSLGQPFVYKLGVGVDNYLTNIYTEDVSGSEEIGINLGSNLIDGEGFADKACRLYPEVNSPFPQIQFSKIARGEFSDSDSMSSEAPYLDIRDKAANFANANICQTGSGSALEDEEYPFAQGTDCECHYTKATYGSETLYFPYDYDNHIPDSIEIDYGSGGSTLSIKNKTKYLGWKGFCLDKEQSLFINNTESLTEDMKDYRCLTWYPIDLLSGEIDAYGASEEAEVSYNKVGDNDKLCVVGEDYVTTEDRVYCGRVELGYCNVLLYIPEGSKVNPDKVAQYTSEVLNYDNEGNQVGMLDTGWLPANKFEYHDGTVPYCEGSSCVGNPVIFSSIAANRLEATPGVPNNGKFPAADFGILMSDCSFIGGTCTSIDGTSSDVFAGQYVFNELFDPPVDSEIKYFFLDEGVNKDGDKNINTHTSGSSKYQTGSKIVLEGYSRPSDRDCEDGLAATESLAQKYAAGSTTWCRSQGKHLVDWKCHSEGWCSWANRWDACKVWCNPLEFNYYVYADPVANDICTNTDCSGNDKGLQCLETKNDIYVNLASYVDEDLDFDITECKIQEVNDFDCDFVQCVQSQNNSPYYCEQYNDCLIYNYNAGEDFTDENENGMWDEGDGTFMDPSEPLVDTGYDTVDGEGNPITVGADNEIWDGPIIISNDLYYEAYGEANDDGDIVQESCLNSEIEVNCTSDNGYDTGSEGTDCGDDCIKTCKTYVDLDNVVYNSNNFYLNRLDLDKLGDDVCIVNGESICAKTLSGNVNEYNEQRAIRFDEIYELSGIDGAEWSTVNSPFSANSVEDFQPLDLRNLINVVDRSFTSNDIFNDYYSDLNASPAEDLGDAKYRLENVVIEIPNNNFQQYDANVKNWSRPEDWSGNYWKIAKSSESEIRQTNYDENNGFSEGDSGISVNSTHNQHIIKEDGNLYAYLMFYAYTSPGATPIQEISIDWTGVNVDKLVLRGPFKNHKQDCVRKCGVVYGEDYDAIENYEAINWDSEDNNCVVNSDCSPYDDENERYCFSKTWGDHPDACIEDNQDQSQDGYFSYSFIYACDALNDYWKEDCTGYDANIQGGCCVYTPTVTITDNWGKQKTENLGDCNNGDNICSVIVIPK